MAKRRAFMLKNLDAYMEVYKRAKANGKKPGDSMQAEFDEVMKEHPEWFEFLGDTDDDVDQIAGNLREEGVKVLSIPEIERAIKRSECKECNGLGIKDNKPCPNCTGQGDEDVTRA